MTLTIGQPDIAALERACLTAVPAQRVAFDGSFVVQPLGCNFEIFTVYLQREAHAQVSSTHEKSTGCRINCVDKGKKNSINVVACILCVRVFMHVNT